MDTLDVEALVLAAGRGERLGRGPKALLVLDGLSLLARAVDVVRAVARRVIVGVPAGCVDQARALLGEDDDVVVGGNSRLETELRLFGASAAGLLVLHDVVHPFATPDLARRVLEAARERGAAMAAVPVDSNVYASDGARLGRVRSAGRLWSSRKPLAFSRTALARGLAELPLLPADAGMVEIVSAAGQEVAIVPDEPWSLKITTAADWALAQALAPLVRSGRLRPEPAPPGAPACAPPGAEAPRGRTA